MSDRTSAVRRSPAHSCSVQQQISSNAFPAAKRRRPSSDQTSHEGASNDQDEEMTLPLLCLGRRWSEAKDRVRTHPDEALHDVPSQGRTSSFQGSCSQSSTPLALACRYEAPVSTVQAILEAYPTHLRKLNPSRGNPLHEALGLERISSEVVSLLLKADEQLSLSKIAEDVSDQNGSKARSQGDLCGTRRAALMQDVDGNTPLHLLVRRVFRSVQSDSCLGLLETVVQSCPEAVGVPDLGEYEETPLVMAIKGSLYATSGSDSDIDYSTLVEKRIHDVVRLMLRYYPMAASVVQRGARGDYTALHSAVFHGRCADTIRLLLRAEASQRFEDPNSSSVAALRANTQGETPLHFAAMRGECARTIDTLSKAAPEAVIRRDNAGLTPLHWLWIRLASRLQSLESDISEENENIELDFNAVQDFLCPVEKNEGEISCFDGKYFLLMQQVDPPVDFLRMRHVPLDFSHPDFETKQVRKVEKLLKILIRRHTEKLERVICKTEPQIDATTEDLQDSSSTTDPLVAHRSEFILPGEDMVAFFWMKVTSMLRALNCSTSTPKEARERNIILLVHTASRCAPNAIVRVAVKLLPKQMRIVDSRGRLPLHHVTMRTWHPLEISESPAIAGQSPAIAEQINPALPTLDSEESARTEECSRSMAIQMVLAGDSLRAFQHVFKASPPQAACTSDYKGRLPLHYAVETLTLVSRTTEPKRSQVKLMMNSILQLLRELVGIHPESLERRDGEKKVYPFLLPVLMEGNADTERERGESMGDQEFSGRDPMKMFDMPLSITYTLFRECPSLGFGAETNPTAQSG